MSLETTGKLHKKFEIESKSATFQTREFVLEIADGNYPQLIKFQIVQERCNIIDNVNEGDMVKVWFDLRGREWNGKYLTNLNAWRVEREGATNAGTSNVPNPEASNMTAAAPSNFPSANDEPPAMDDLPF